MKTAHKHSSKPPAPPPKGTGRLGIGRRFELMSQFATRWTGSSWAFAVAVLVILAWLISGPFFPYSDTWQLVINTSTTIVTFLMVFLIQRSQNKESLAVQLKLNEIVAAIEGASNRMVDVEELSEEELDHLRLYYQELAKLAKSAVDIRHSHSIDEAKERHEKKSAVHRTKRKS